MIKTIKKLLIPLSLSSLTGCDMTGLVVKDEGKIVYTFTWTTILILFVATIIILWLIRYYIKNAK